MKTRLICGVVLSWVVMSLGSCSKQPYFEIPLDENGDALISPVTRAESNGIREGEEAFDVSVDFKNAKVGDAIFVELLSLQPVGDSGDLQLLPLQGTQKEFQLGERRSLSVTYTAAEAQLEKAGDYVVITFSSAYDSATLRIEMESAE